MKRIATILTTAPIALVATFALSAPAHAATPYNQVEVGQTPHQVRQTLHAKPHVLVEPFGTGFGKREVITYRYAPTSIALVTFFKPRGTDRFLVIDKVSCEVTAGGPVCTP